MDKSQGLKWFIFYTKIRPILSLVFSVIIIVDIFRDPAVYFSDFWRIFYTITVFAQPILSALTMIKSFGDYASFVKFIKIILLYEVFSTAYQSAITQMLQPGAYSPIMTFVATAVAMFFLWYMLNKKYFEKRLISK